MVVETFNEVIRVIKASIIILTKNAGDGFERTLEMIFSQKYDEEYEVIMIDSGSKDNTLTIAKKYPTKIYEIPPEEFGHGKTRNFGASLSKGNYLVFITQDAVPINNKWLESITKPLSDSRVAGVFGKQIPKENANPMERFFLSQFYPERRKIRYSSQNLKINEILFSDVNSAIRKDIWKRYKFNENIPIAEDYDIAKRILADNYIIIYEPNAGVYHSHNYSLKTVFKRFYHSGVSLKEIGIFEFNSPDFIIEGLRYFMEEMNFLFHNGYKKWIPYAIIYDFCKFFGMFLGKKGRYVPTIIKKKLSL